MQTPCLCPAYSPRAPWKMVHTTINTSNQLHGDEELVDDVDGDEEVFDVTARLT